jgi:hypothetical protein
MNWKNRTYFQGRSARPFAQAADGRRAQSRSKPPKEGERPRRPFRRFLGWLFLLTVVFGAGLAVGLVEDEKMEELFGKTLEVIFGKKKDATDQDWKKLWDESDRIPTWHFNERMECRQITTWEIDFAVEHGVLNSIENGDQLNNLKYKVTGETKQNRSLTVVFAAADPPNGRINLVTVWENGKDHDCP